MAHFAELDKDNVVLRVVVVDDKDTSDNNGIEKEEIGAKYLQDLLGGTWVQTSYNAKIRKKYAAKGDTYVKEKDYFISPSAYASWVFDEAIHCWQPPVKANGIDGEIWN